MKVLFTIMALDYSGAPKMIAWVANQMAAKGHEVHLLTFFAEKQRQILDERVVMHSLNVVKSKNWLVRNTLGMVKTISKLHRAVRAVKPDVTVSFHDAVVYMYLPIGRYFGKSRFIVSERADPYAWNKRTSWIRPWLMGFAHGNIFQTQGAQKYFEKHKRVYRNSIVIPNPVVVKESVRSLQQNIPGAAERDKRIVAVGRLSLIQKRQDVMLDAFKIFHKKHPEYKLVIYGDGPDKAKIQAMIDQAGLSESVILAGRTDQVEEDIFRASALVLTSDFEGIPNSLIEALSVGVPCVSTDCSPGGAALLIRDGENGFLVPRGDAEAVADRLLKIVEDPRIADSFSREGPRIIQEFAEDRIAEQWEQYFQKISQCGDK